VKNISDLVDLNKWQPNVKDIVMVREDMQNRIETMIELFGEEAITDTLEESLKTFDTLNNIEAIKTTCQKYFMDHLKLILQCVSYKEFVRKCEKERLKLIKRVLGIDDDFRVINLLDNMNNELNNAINKSSEASEVIETIGEEIDLLSKGCDKRNEEV
jgi:hypothetical protein